MTFNDLNLTASLRKALHDLSFTTPTPIQEQAFNSIASGKDVVGIAQTGTGKTLAYLLPILRGLSFSQQEQPRILILAPTRELVVQITEETKKLSTYSNTRILGVYGGTNINTQKQAIAEGIDILIATPGRLYDLAMSRVLQLKSIQKLVIDEVDIMLDLGFRHQLINIFDCLPERRQNIMFSATMTEDVDILIDDFFRTPKKIAIAVSGTPLDNIQQQRYDVPNYYTKLNLVTHLLEDSDTFNKVLIFVSHKKIADRLFEALNDIFHDCVSVIHSNKTQNYRLRSIEQFKAGIQHILIATDIMARGLDIDDISHVINFDTPNYPENYMHRIGRTGRAKRQGHSILLSTKKEQDALFAIEALMQLELSLQQIPKDVEISNQLLPEERTQIKEHYNPTKQKEERGAAFHEKKEKNRKTNEGGSYRKKLAAKYKKPKTKGDKNFNRRHKKRR